MKQSVYTLIFYFFISPLFSVTAYQGEITLSQPNNDTFSAFIKGDEWQHWYESIDGYTISKNNQNEWVYVESIDKGSFVLTNILVSNNNLSNDLLKFKKHIKPKRKNIQPLQDIPDINNLSRTEFKIPMLLIEFPDLLANNTVEQFDNMMNMINYESSQGITGSFYDYFQEVSYGQFDPSTDVNGWYMTDSSYTVYGDGAPNGWNMVRIMIRDAVNEACEDGMDWSIYDNDGNGTVDALNIVHSGLGAEEGGNTQYIWSHSWQLGPYATQCNGININNYVIQPERTNMGMGGMVHIGVFAHEFGHALGVPDLYDTDYSSPGIGNWGLMAGGSWGGDGGSPWYPVHMTAWIKYQLGWVDPITITEPIITYEIDNVQENPLIFKMDGIDNNSEYYLFENRQKILYDQNLPHHGLFIWHVNESVGGNQNDWNRLVDLEQADGYYHLNNNGNSGDPGDPFPGYSNNTKFAYDTDPNSIFYTGNPSGISVVNIEENDGIITATFRNIPTLAVNNLTVEETNGDNDSIINPGESASLIVNLFNPSNETVSNIIAIPQNDNDLIDINTFEITFPDLNAFGNSTANESINIELSPYIPIGNHSIEINVLGDLESTSFEQIVQLNFNISILQTGFPIEIETEVISSPLFLDSDLGINNPAIVFCDNNGLVHMVDNAGNDLWDAPFDTGNEIWGAPAAADIDNDSEIEIVIASKSKQIFIIDINGNQEAYFDASQFLTATPVIGNIDSDNELEIIIGSMSNSGKVYGLNHDLSAVEGYPVEINEKMWVGAATIDINNDGMDEIIITTDAGNLYLINNDGTINSNFSINTGSNIRSAPSIAVFENSQEKLIFFGNDAGEFYCINSLGEIQFIINTGEVIRSSPSLIEYNNNTYVFFTSDNNQIHAIDMYGNYLPNWPIHTGNEIKSSCTFSDLDSNGIPEVILSSRNGYIYVYNLNGTLYDNFPMDLTRTIENTPIAFDIDNDGDIEILTGDSKGISAIDVKDIGQISPWNIHRSNPYRNGVFYAINTNFCEEPIAGNLNCDSFIDVSDIIILIEFILEQVFPSGFQFNLGDLNNDNILDILDIIIMVNTILE